MAQSFDKRGKADRSIDKRERRAAEGVGPYGRLTRGGNGGGKKEEPPKQLP